VTAPNLLPPSSARPKIVTVTGAAGQIGYAALFRIGAGALLGRGYR
jgi:malate dehydrogenase